MAQRLAAAYGCATRSRKRVLRPSNSALDCRRPLTGAHWRSPRTTSCSLRNRMKRSFCRLRRLWRASGETANVRSGSSLVSRLDCTTWSLVQPLVRSAQETSSGCILTFVWCCPPSRCALSCERYAGPPDFVHAVRGRFSRRMLGEGHRVEKSLVDRRCARESRCANRVQPRSNDAASIGLDWPLHEKADPELPRSALNCFNFLPLLRLARLPVPPLPHEGRTTTSWNNRL